MDQNFDVAKLRAWRGLDAKSLPAQEISADGVGGAALAEEGTSAQSTPLDDAPDASALARKSHRSRLVAQYNLDSEYIGVGQLARILGLSASAIYGHIRAGRFFLPYRLFNAAPKIFIDDLVEWHCSGQGVVPAFCEKPSRETAVDEEDGAGGKGRALSRAEVNEAVEKAAEDAMRAMGIEPSKRRRRRP